MALADNRKNFSDRVERIREQHAQRPIMRALPLIDTDPDAPVPEYASSRGRVRVSTNARGPIYLLAAFCAGLCVMAAISGGAQLAAMAAGL